MDADLLTLMKTVGPLVAFVAFVLVWFKQSEQRREQRETERETRMGLRLDEQQKRYEETVTGVIKENSASNMRIATSLDSLTRVIERCPKGKE